MNDGMCNPLCTFFILWGYVAISDGISTYADFQADSYHVCSVLLISYPHS